MTKKLKLSKGPVPPARLPTAEEKTRGPRMSDMVNDFRHYLTPEEVKSYKRNHKLPPRHRCSGVVKHVFIWQQDGGVPDEGVWVPGQEDTGEEFSS